MTISAWNSAAVLANVRACVMRGVVRGTEGVRTEMIRLILETPKTGRTYARRSIVHRASAPGEPPASDTGRLVNSIETSYEAERLAGKVTVHSEYAPFLEFGTQKMEPRPFARVALANKVKEIADDIKDEVARGLAGTR